MEIFEVRGPMPLPHPVQLLSIDVEMIKGYKCLYNEEKAINIMKTIRNEIKRQRKIISSIDG